MDFPYVMSQLKKDLALEFKGIPFTCMYVCGADMAARCGLESGASFDTLCIARPGESAEHYLRRYHGKNGFFYFETDQTEDISSSQIRQLLKQNKPIHHLVPSKVSHYILQNKLIQN